MSSSSSRSPELRRDSVFNRWVIFSPARSRRPSDFKSHSSSNPSKNPNPSSSCPFCIGNESQCAPEIFRFPKGSSDWKVRVIENLFPALRRDEEGLSDPESSDLGRCAVAGFGFHDVVIETPNHSVHLPDMSAVEVGEVVRAYKERVLQLKRVGSVKYVQAVDFGGLLKLMLHKLSRQLDDPPYNFMIHTAPFELPVDHLRYTHWFLQIVPQLSVIGGFEMGSGCYINPVFPEDAAKLLREIDCPK